MSFLAMTQMCDPVRLEGASELTTPANFVATENSPELAMLNRANIGHGMFKQFASISGGGVIDMSNARFVSTLPGYVFCASWGPLPKLKQYMTEEAEHKYKACLKIRNFHRLRRRIVETGRIRELNCSFSDVFDQGQIGMVQYEIRSRSIARAEAQYVDRIFAIMAVSSLPFKADLSSWQEKHNTY
jgi:hypothetical protein